MYYTISEAAGELNVSRQTVYRWIADNKIPTEKIGGVILVEKKAIMNFGVKRFQESVLQTVFNSTDKYIRREFGYSEEDTIVAKEPESDYLVFIVTRKSGNREKIKIGGMDITLSTGREQPTATISDIKFKDFTRKNLRKIKENSKRKKGK